MSTETFFPAGLLQPVNEELPSGINLRFTPEWKRLEEAKRADDDLNKGDWETKEQKTANWEVVGDLAADLLARKSKDLRLAVYLVEASIRRDGFPAVSEGFRFLQEMVTRFWDKGLHPEPDGDNFEERAAALGWINEKLPDLLRDQKLTKRPEQDRRPDYSFSEYIDAREAKKKGRDNEAFSDYQAAVVATSRAFYETLAENLTSGIAERKALKSLFEEKFGSAELAPGSSEASKALEEIVGHVETILHEKPVEPAGDTPGQPGSGLGLGASFSAFGPTMATSSGDWAKAEELVRAGQIEKGLAEMTLLAQREPSGRARFQRKLLLADIAVRMHKDHLAQSILEELAEQVDSFKLVEWETTEVVGAVWTRLYRLYKRTGGEDRAQQYYQRLCRVDPWQAFSCTET